jgi:hypothetical protein
VNPVLQQVCETLQPSGRLANAFGIDNEENGTPMDYCVPRRAWRELCPDVVNLG